MCGILGQVDYLSTSAWNESKFKKALSLQKHRGPDDSGVVVGEDFIFGHRRLSIIDLDSHAKQPMTSSDGEVILVFNGEIYNYQELRKDLVKKGYSFSTKSDTEVLLYSYYEHGIECIQNFIGMFAFAIFDNRTQKTFIVRDRLGVKPLYYCKIKDTITFSSEIKSILELADLDVALNIKAVSSYLSFRYPILDDTFFDSIYSLPPAHYIELTKGSFFINEYWSLVDSFKEQKVDKGEEFYLNKLQHLLESSVKYRMISDVPIGVFLSGGVDSSVITSIMANESKDPVNTFTIGFNESEFNEFSYADIIAKKYNTRHHKIIIDSADYLENLEKLIKYKDAPLSVPNEVPLYIMSKELKKNITVVLSGEGADEIFAGYGRIFRSPYDLYRIQNIDSLDLSDDEKDKLCKNFIKKYIVDSFESDVDHFHNIYSYTSLLDKKALLNSSIPLDDIENDFLDKFIYLFNEIKNETYYNKMMYVFEKIHLVGLLQRLDVSTMAASIEARVPFVDHRLVEFAFSIPFKYKIKWGKDNSKYNSRVLMSDQISEKYDTPKYILKKAFENKLPNEILYRKKVGFPVPLYNWLGGEFKKYAETILLSSAAQSRGIYNVANIEKMLNNDRVHEDHGLAMKIWMLVNLELFCMRYFNKSISFKG